MRHYVFFAAISLLVSGCVTTPYQRTDGPVPISRGSIDGFTALVPSSTTVPHCEEPTETRAAFGQRAVALVYPRPAAQQVTVVLGEDGAPTGYIDVRGDLSISDDETGDRTTIALYLDQGYAILSNRVGSGEPTMVEVPLTEALDSERLGNPREMLRRVIAECRGAD